MYRENFLTEMVVKKSNIISIALILALAAPVTAASNTLVQMDLKKSSADSVDVTLFTTDSYKDNVLVRKKSDNKYVILIPKVQSSGVSRAGLNGVRDLISDVDVKTVNDTTGGYTKVTLITTKPLNIRTNTQKSTPLTQEDKEYNTLIAQANAVKNNIAKPASVNKPVQKTEVTTNKAVTKTPEKQVKKEEPKKVDNKKIENKPQIKLTEVNPEDIQKRNRKEYLQRLVNEAKMEQNSDVLVVPQKAPELSEDIPDIKDIQDVAPTVEKVSLVSKIKNKLKNASKMPKSVLMLIAALVLFAMAKRGRGTIAVEELQKTEDFQPDLPKNEQFENITANKELTWQEKYQLYLDKSAVPVPRANKKGNYTFIKTPAIQNNEIEEKRIELEKMLNDVAEIQDDFMPEIVEVHSDDEAIHKSIKFKAFDKRRTSLSMTRRGNKSRFKKYENEIPLHEQKTIDLGESPLHTNPRSLKDANLKITDVDKNRIKYEPKDYIMSSVDEFFSIIDKEQEAQQKEIAKPAVSNPIAQSKKEIKKSNNLIVKSAYSIDDDKGFYVVNQNGQNALIGKVKDEVFVLKKFDSNVTNPVQVRHDNANVYMVKAGKFKSLVEVNDDKMGVLIEL